MAQFFTDFEHGALDTTPTGWTEDGAWYRLTERTDFENDRAAYFQFADNSENVTWDDVGSVGDVDAIAHFRIENLVINVGSATVALRVTPDGIENSTGYYAEWIGDNFRILKSTGLGTTTIDQDPAPSVNEEGAMGWIRFRATGGTLEAKAWTGNAGDEPTEWMISGSDSDFATGRVGHMTHISGSGWTVGQYGVGTGTDPAPTEPLVARGNRTVDLAWTDNATGEDGYNIYAEVDPEGATTPTFPEDFAQIDQIAANSTGYTDTEAANEGSIWYAVTAFAEGGGGAVVESDPAIAEVEEDDTIVNLAGSLSMSGGFSGDASVASAVSGSVTGSASLSGDLGIVDPWGFFRDISVPSRVEDSDWSVDGELLAIATDSADGLHIYPTSDFDNRVTGNPTFGSYSVEFSPDNTMLASGAGNGNWIVYDVSDWSTVASGSLPDDEAWVAWSNDTAFLAVGTRDNTVEIFDANDNFSSVTSWNAGARIEGIDWSDDWLALVHRGDNCDIYNIGDADGTGWDLEISLTDAGGNTENVEFSPDEELIAWSSRDGNIYIRNNHTWDGLVTISVGADGGSSPRDVTWSPTQEFIAHGDSGIGYAAAYETETWTLENQFDAGTGDSYDIKFAYQQDFLGVGATDDGSQYRIFHTPGTVAEEPDPVVDLAGSVSGSLSTASEPVRSRSVSGAVQGTLDSTGTIVRARAVSGAVSAGASLSGLPTTARAVSGSVNGTGLVSGSTIRSRAVAGSVTGSLNASGAASAIRGAIGSVTGSGTLSGAADVVSVGFVDLVGSVSGALAAESNAVRSRAVSGDVSGTLTTTGSTGRARAVAGAVQGTLDSTGSIVRARAVSGAVSAGATLSGLPATIRSVSGSVVGSGTLSALPARARSVSGDIGGVLAIEATSVRFRLAEGHANFSMAMSGAADVVTPGIADLAGSIAGALNASGDSSTIRGASGSVSGSLDASGASVRSRLVSGDVSGAFSTAATAVRSRSVSGAVQGTLSSTGSIVRARAVSGAVSAGASLSGVLDATAIQVVELAGSISGSLDASADPSRARAVSGSVSGAFSVGGSVVEFPHIIHRVAAEGVHNIHRSLEGTFDVTRSVEGEQRLVERVEGLYRVRVQRFGTYAPDRAVTALFRIETALEGTWNVGRDLLGRVRSIPDDEDEE